MIEKCNLRIIVLLFTIIFGISRAEQETSSFNITQELYDSLWEKSTQSDVIAENAKKLVKSFLNLSANPCEDFNEYACGNFGNVYNKSSSLFSMVEENYDKYIRKLLLAPEEDILDDPEQSYFRDDEELKYALSDAEVKARSTYQACVNYKQIVKEGLQPAIDFVKSTGDWLYSDDVEERNVWTSLLKSRTLQGRGLFSKNARGKIFITPGAPILNWNVVSNITQKVKERFANAEKIENSLKVFGVKSTEIPKITTSILEFDILLSEITQKVGDEYGAEAYYLADLMEKFPSIDWEEYFEEDFQNDIRDSNASTIAVRRGAYFENIDLLLQHNSNEIIYNYLLFSIGYAALQSTSYNMTNETEWERRCLNNVKKIFEPAIGALFLRRYLSKPVEDDVTRMNAEVDHEYVVLIEKSVLIDEKIKQDLVDKVANTSSNLGLSNKTELIFQLKTYFQDFEIVPDNHFAITLNLIEFAGKLMGNRSYEHSFSPLTVNAFYDPEESSRTYFLGFLLPLIYHLKFPRWINYGNLGSTLGHELIHAFDIDSYLYKAGHNERLKHSIYNILQYFKASLCLARQYNEIELGNRTHVDGIMTLGENVSDLIGVIISRNAYLKWLAMNPERLKNESIEGLNLTLNQLFFIGYAQSYCDSSEPDSHDVHTPNQKRAAGTFVNLDEFSKAFNCPIGSKMNPKKKCTFF